MNASRTFHTPFMGCIRVTQSDVYVILGFYLSLYLFYHFGKRCIYIRLSRQRSARRCFCALDRMWSAVRRCAPFALPSSISHETLRSRRHSPSLFLSLPLSLSLSLPLRARDALSRRNASLRRNRVQRCISVAAQTRAAQRSTDIYLRVQNQPEAPGTSYARRAMPACCALLLCSPSDNRARDLSWDLFLF